MYIPTMEEMKEIGFNITDEGMFHNDTGVEVIAREGWCSFYINYGDPEGADSGFMRVYPESRQDIETLIRLFTPPSLKG